MRNSEPRYGRASARKYGLIWFRWGSKSRMNSHAGRRMNSSYSPLCFSNHSRRLFRLRRLRKSNNSGVKYGFAGIDFNSKGMSVFRYVGAAELHASSVTRFTEEPTYRLTPLRQITASLLLKY